MKLNSAQLERTLGQFDARAIPDGHPLIRQLNDLFGEHTFLLDHHGLNIVEPIEAAGDSAMVVNLASWSDESPVGSGSTRARSDRCRHHAWIEALIRRGLHRAIG